MAIEKLIISVTLLVVMMVVGYLMVTKPVYKAEIFFLPPLQQDIQELSLLDVQVVKLRNNHTSIVHHQP